MQFVTSYLHSFHFISFAFVGFSVYFLWSSSLRLILVFMPLVIQGLSLNFLRESLTKGKYLSSIFLQFSENSGKADCKFKGGWLLSEFVGSSGGSFGAFCRK